MSTLNHATFILKGSNVKPCSVWAIFSFNLVCFRLTQHLPSSVRMCGFTRLLFKFTLTSSYFWRLNTNYMSLGRNGCKNSNCLRPQGCNYSLYIIIFILLWSSDIKKINHGLYKHSWFIEDTQKLLPYLCFTECAAKVGYFCPLYFSNFFPPPELQALSSFITSLSALNSTCRRCGSLDWLSIDKAEWNGRGSYVLFNPSDATSLMWI